VILAIATDDTIPSLTIGQSQVVFALQVERSITRVSRFGERSHVESRSVTLQGPLSIGTGIALL
jgi:hypothetical protein